MSDEQKGYPDQEEETASTLNNAQSESSRERLGLRIKSRVDYSNSGAGSSAKAQKKKAEKEALKKLAKLNKEEEDNLKLLGEEEAGDLEGVEFNSLFYQVEVKEDILNNRLSSESDSFRSSESMTNENQKNQSQPSGSGLNIKQSLRTDDLDRLSKEELMEVVRRLDRVQLGGQDIGNIKIPVFGGGESDNIGAWIYKVERQFSLYNLSDGQKINVAIGFLKGKALACVRVNDAVENWEDFKDLLKKHCLSTGHQRRLRTQLRELKQGDDVVEFVKSFTTLANEIEGMDEQEIFYIFLDALRPKARCAVLLSKCNKLTTAIEELYNFEECNGGKKKQPVVMNVNQVRRPFLKNKFQAQSGGAKRFNRPNRFQPKFRKNFYGSRLNQPQQISIKHGKMYQAVNKQEQSSATNASKSATFQKNVIQGRSIVQWFRKSNSM